MTDTHYSTPERGLPPYVVSANHLKCCSTTLVPPMTAHQTRVHASDTIALVVYSPPYTECVRFDGNTGKASRIPIADTDCSGCGNE